MRRLVAAVLLLVTTAPAEARTVYLNGVKLDDAVILKNQSFSACDVKFDDNGDVWITAKGVKVALAPASAPVAVKKVWVLASETNRGASQYAVEVWLNGVKVRTVRSGETASAADITKYVKPGQNKLRMVAVKESGDHRASSSAADALEVVIGQGDSPGSIVELVRYVRTAAETGAFSDDFSFAPK